MAIEVKGTYYEFKINQTRDGVDYIVFNTENVLEMGEIVGEGIYESDAASMMFYNLGIPFDDTQRLVSDEELDRVFDEIIEFSSYGYGHMM